MISELTAWESETDVMNWLAAQTGMNADLSY